jgi:hypothetical protein
MREKHNYQYVDDLILGMKTILSERRCSFSEEEKVHLANAIRYLEDSKKIGEEKPIDWSLIFKGIDLLNRVFSNFDDFKNLF